MSALTDQPTYAELLARLQALENRVTLDQLPLAKLRAALIENGEPLDLSVLALNTYMPLTLTSISATDTVSSAAYAALATVTKVVLPANGDYEIGFQCGRVDCAAPDGTGQVLVSVKVGSAAATDALSAGFRSISYNPGGRVMRFNGLQTDTVIELQAKQIGGNGRVFERDLWARRLP